jgi:hypothetical protein
MCCGVSSSKLELASAEALKRAGDEFAGKEKKAYACVMEQEKQNLHSFSLPWNISIPWEFL